VRSDLPTGTVTFLFTDVEDSTRLLHSLGAEAYAKALAEHRQAIRDACTAEGGVEVDTQGDAFFFAFPTAPGAVGAAAAFIEALAAGAVAVRVGLHTGTPLLTDEGYVGDDVHRAARIAACGHGGQVLVSTSTAQLIESKLLDLGEHRLKDLSAPERIYQLGDGDFPALTSLYRTNLPVPATPFLGREREVREVVDLLAEGDTRLVTLTGPGGTGKTRLALQAAGMASDAYPDGVYWIPLAPLRNPALVLVAAAQTLGSKNGLAEHIADKSMLCLFDNFEQVVEAASELAALVSACPHLDVLVTSRERLRIGVERNYPVPPLVEEDGEALFTARARAVDPAFVASDAVHELCLRLDELPLALELAAARTAIFSPEQLLEKLSQRLDLLKGDRDADPRQQTLRATIEWSYGLLSEDEQRLFRRLAVFSGGCTYEAAEKIAEADPDTLQSLVEKSLLRFSSQRFWMLETIRGYARERLEDSGEMDRLRGRHAFYFTPAAEVKHAEWMYGDEVRSPYRWFRVEQANLRDAVEWAAVDLDLDLELRLLHAARQHSTFSGRERLRLLESALTRLSDERSLRHARALANAADTALEVDDHEGALGYHERALALYRSLNDGEGAARSLVGRGWDLWELGRAAEAKASFENALATAKRAEATPVIQGASSSLATTSLIEGDFDAALRFAAEAQEAGERLHSKRVVGLVELRKGNAAEAVLILSDALASQYELGYEPSLPGTLDALATALVKMGNVEKAVVLTGQSGSLREAMGFTADSFFRGLREEVAGAGLRQLGEDGYRAAMTRGEAMSVDDAVGYAVASID
jgi:predicted ATPase/class 3 adenylate cyclase